MSKTKSKTGEGDLGDAREMLALVDASDSSDDELHAAAHGDEGAHAPRASGDADWAKINEHHRSEGSAYLRG